MSKELTKEQYLQIVLRYLGVADEDEYPEFRPLVDHFCARGFSTWQAYQHIKMLIKGPDHETH